MPPDGPRRRSSAGCGRRRRRDGRSRSGRRSGRRRSRAGRWSVPSGDPGRPGRRIRQWPGRVHHALVTRQLLTALETPGSVCGGTTRMPITTRASLGPERTVTWRVTNRHRRVAHGCAPSRRCRRPRHRAAAAYMPTAHETPGSVCRRVRRDDGRRRPRSRALAVAADGAAEAPARGAATVVAGGGDTRPRRSVSRHHGQRPGRAWPVQHHVDGRVDAPVRAAAEAFLASLDRATARQDAQAGGRPRVAEVDEPELLRPRRRRLPGHVAAAARGRLRAAARRAERSRADADARHHAPQRNARRAQRRQLRRAAANGATT